MNEIDNKKIKELFSKITHRLINAYNNFEIWKIFKNSISEENPDKDINLRIYNRYIGLFSVILRSSIVYYFLLELNKFFDNNKKNLSLKKISNKINDNSLISEIECILSENDNIILKLKNYRDQNLAHDDIEKDENNIKINEIEQLFSLVELIINKISYYIDKSSWSFKGIRKDSSDDIELFLKDMRFYFLREDRIREDFVSKKISWEEYKRKLP